MLDTLQNGKNTLFGKEIEKLQTIQDINLLQDSIAAFCRYDIREKEEYKEYYLKYFEILRKRIRDDVLLKGEMPSVKLLNLYKTFHDIVSFQPDPTIKALREYLLQNFLQTDPNKSEKYIFNHLVAVCDFLNGDFEKGVREYIKRNFSLEINAAISSGAVLGVETFRGFLNDNEPDFEMIIDIVLQLAKAKNFFNSSRAAQRSLVIWLLHITWNIPAYHNHKSWLKLFDPFADLCNEAIKRDDIQTQMYLHFFIYSVCGNNYQSPKEWRLFNSKIDKPASLAYKEFAKKHNLKPCKKINPNSKIKIAFIKDRIVENSPFKIEYSLIKSLLKDEEFKKHYEISFVSLTYIDKAEDQQNELEKLYDLGIEVIRAGLDINQEQGLFYDHLSKALKIREILIDKETDIMIGSLNNYDIMDFLFATRTAPKQIFWCHGNFEYDVEGIDERISHFMPNSPTFEYKRFNISIDTSFMMGSNKEQQEAKRIKENRFKNKTVLGVITRYVKLDSIEYLKTVKEILDKNKDAIFLACGVGNIDSIEAKLSDLKIDKERFVFEWMVNANIYGYVIDIFLDTFPMPQGTSRDEYMSKGFGATLTADWYFKYSLDRDEKAIESCYGDLDLFHTTYSKSKEDYIKNCNLLIKDKDMRKKLAKANQKDMELFLNNVNTKEFQKLITGQR